MIWCHGCGSGFENGGGIEGGGDDLGVIKVVLTLEGSSMW